jgi:hypothetical protein
MERRWCGLSNPRAIALQTAVMRDLGEADRRRLIQALDVIRATAAALDGDAVLAARPPRPPTGPVKAAPPAAELRLPER